MTAELSTKGNVLALFERTRMQAFLSTFVVALGATIAALLAVGAMIVAFPLMLAASTTVRASGTRRGWKELEPIEA
ncbi:MAG: hypothetical protein AAGH41_06105 [Pseudomonadota bacterium]